MIVLLKSLSTIKSLWKKSLKVFQYCVCLRKGHCFNFPCNFPSQQVVTFLIVLLNSGISRKLRTRRAWFWSTQTNKTFMHQREAFDPLLARTETLTLSQGCGKWALWSPTGSPFLKLCTNMPKALFQLLSNIFGNEVFNKPLLSGMETTPNIPATSMEENTAATFGFCLLGFGLEFSPCSGLRKELTVPWRTFLPALSEGMFKRNEKSFSSVPN